MTAPPPPPRVFYFFWRFKQKISALELYPAACVHCLTLPPTLRIYSSLDILLLLHHRNLRLLLFLLFLPHTSCGNTTRTPWLPTAMANRDGHSHDGHWNRMPGWTSLTEASSPQDATPQVWPPPSLSLSQRYKFALQYTGRCSPGTAISSPYKFTLQYTGRCSPGPALRGLSKLEAQLSALFLVTGYSIL